MQERQVNAPLGREAWAVATLRTAAGQTRHPRPVPGSLPPARVELAPGQTLLRVVLRPAAPRETVLRRGRQAVLCPLGFVFGADAAGLKAARELGMNSVHLDYSAAELFPAGPDAANPAAVAELHERHRRIAAKRADLFPATDRALLARMALQSRRRARPKTRTASRSACGSRSACTTPVYLELLHRYWAIDRHRGGRRPQCLRFCLLERARLRPGRHRPPRCAISRAAMRRDYGTLDGFNQAMGTRFAAWGRHPTAPGTGMRTGAYWYQWGPLPPAELRRVSLARNGRFFQNLRARRPPVRQASGLCPDRRRPLLQ